MEMKMDVQMGGACFGVCIAQTQEEAELLAKFMEYVRDGVPMQLEADEPTGYVLVDELDTIVDEKVYKSFEDAQDAAAWQITNNEEDYVNILPVGTAICAAKHSDEVIFE